MVFCRDACSVVLWWTFRSEAVLAVMAASPGRHKSLARSRHHALFGMKGKEGRLTRTPDRLRRQIRMWPTCITLTLSSA